MNALFDKLVSEGGLLRVRAVLALAMTGGGIGYLLVNQAMPPEAYNVLWTGALGFYFGSRSESPTA